MYIHVVRFFEVTCYMFFFRSSILSIGDNKHGIVRGYDFDIEGDEDF